MIQQIFTSIYEKNVWGSKETRSGKGSEKKATTKLVKALPEVFAKYKITGIVDIGCGDCNWMHLISIENYLGIDVVKKLINENTKKYGSDRKFVWEHWPEWLTYLYGKKYQAVIFADMLVHLPNYIVLQHLRSVKLTDIQYIFATTFPEIKQNTDVELSEIAWRPINMEIYPYNLGKPIEMLRYNEFYVTQTGEKIKEKYIGMWKLNKEDKS